MQVTHSPTTRTFTMTGKAWSNTYPIEDLGKWLTIYQTLREEHPKSHGAYDAGIAGLERLAAELGAAA